jgi:hypothetical protein
MIALIATLVYPQSMLFHSGAVYNATKALNHHPTGHIA